MNILRKMMPALPKVDVLLFGVMTVAVLKVSSAFAPSERVNSPRGGQPTMITILASLDKMDNSLTWSRVQTCVQNPGRVDCSTVHLKDNDIIDSDQRELPRRSLDRIMTPERQYAPGDFDYQESPLSDYNRFLRMFANMKRHRQTVSDQRKKAPAWKWNLERDIRKKKTCLGNVGCRSNDLDNSKHEDYGADAVGRKRRGAPGTTTERQ